MKYLIFGGQLFFVAGGLFVVVATLDLARILDRRPLAQRGAGIIALLAMGLAALSGTPMPVWQAGVTLACTFAYLFAGFASSDARRRIALGALAIAVAAGSMALEAPWHRTTVASRPSRLIVIGDSLASGGFGEAEPWPAVLGRTLSLPVVNLAAPADTSSRAAAGQIDRLPPVAVGDCVIVEIGGNDMLEGAPPGDFAAALERILSAASLGGRRSVVVLELPLIPGRWQFGMIQRRLAGKYGSMLLPKRVLAAILLRPGNTFDGLHLTQEGHDELARRIAEACGWNEAADRLTARPRDD